MNSSRQSYIFNDTTLVVIAGSAGFTCRDALGGGAALTVMGVARAKAFRAEDMAFIVTTETRAL